MHFLYALLFFLLGTSVVAVPVSETPPTNDEDFQKALRAGRKRVIEKMGWQKAAGPSAEPAKGPVLKPTKPIVEPVGAERLAGWWRSTIVAADIHISKDLELKIHSDNSEGTQFPTALEKNTLDVWRRLEPTAFEPGPAVPRNWCLDKIMITKQDEVVFVGLFHGVWKSSAPLELDIKKFLELTNSKPRLLRKLPKWLNVDRVFEH
ncbi:hypothetical protein F5887DRAFT_990121 [Amanita rubescens]|nr:hypothetical protein F5887DRAFT_990121 [Amanita rubescens]